MIVVEDPESYVLITQSDHAHLAGSIVKLWRADGLSENPRRDDILFAAREHDCGWREADAVPALDSASSREGTRPHDFLSLPNEPRIEIWRRSTERWVDERPYAALLITHHARTLLSDRPGFEALNQELDERYETLLEASSADPDRAEADYRFIHLGDLVSLALCNRWSDPIDRLGMSLWPGENHSLALHPFPLAGATSFTVSYRRIPRRTYTGDADLATELATARWQTLTVRLKPKSVENPDKPPA